MTDILLTTVELIDGVEVEGSAVTIATTDGVAGDPVGTAAAAVAAHVADVTDAHALAGITGLQAALDAKAATTVTDDHETRIDALEVGGGGGAVDSVNGQTGVVVLDATDVGADATGAASAAVTAHEAAANPHPTYLTQAEADALYSPAGSGGAVDSVNGQTGVVVLDADDIADGTVNHAFTTADDTKLAGIAAGATANATDAQLRDRSTHTGSQAAATISDLSEAVDDRVAALLTEGSNVTLNYDDVAGTLTIDAAGGGGSGSSVGSTLYLFHNYI